MKRAACLTLLFASGLVAGEAGISAPALGYLYDPASHTLRAVGGIPGAALTGPALDTGAPIAGAAFSPGQGYALAVDEQSHTARVLVLRTGAATPHPIEGPARPVDRVVLSPTGSSAVLYDAAAGVLQVLTGLPEAPVVAREISLSAAETMAVSDDGCLLLVSSSAASQPVVFLASSAARDVPVPGFVSAMSFRPQSHDVLVAADGRITLIRDIATHATYQVFAQQPDSAVALGFSSDGRRFFAAYRDGAIRTYDLASGESRATACACAPTGLFPMQGDSVFRLNELRSGPLFLFDGASNRVVFVAREDQ
jgi:hypothetical protein